MEDRILALSDAEAVRFVQIIGSAHEGEPDVQEAATPEVQDALDAFVGAPAGETVSEGDLARNALLLYADDPAHREAVAALLEHPPPPQFDAGTTIALTTAVLLILQTHVRFYRDKAGKWTLKIEKKPSSDTLLKPLVQKLLAFLSKGG